MRLWPILRREYLERVRSKSFLIVTLLGPLGMAALTILPSVLMSKQRGKPLRITVLDASGELQGPIEKALAERKADGKPRFEIVARGTDGHEAARARLKGAVLDGSLDGYLYLSADALDASQAEYHGKNVSNLQDLELMDQAVEDTFIAVRLGREGLQADKLAGVLRKLQLRTLRVSDKGEQEDRGGSFILSFMLLMFLYTTVAIWGSVLMNGVIEEKGNRVVEVVVSSVSPQQLFLGKLLGVGAAGLTQFLVWAAFLLGLSLFAGRFALLGDAKLPEIPGSLIALFVVFFLLGYFLYGAMYAAVGAAVNSPQEAQGLVFPVMLPLVMCIMFFPMVLSRPDSTLSVALSFVPFFTPLLMFLRVSALHPPAWQVALSIALTFGTIVLLNWAAARIYRVGILMYGKRPTFPEILKWVRHS